MINTERDKDIYIYIEREGGGEEEREGEGERVKGDDVRRREDQSRGSPPSSL